MFLDSNAINNLRKKDKNLDNFMFQIAIKKTSAFTRAFLYKNILIMEIFALPDYFSNRKPKVVSELYIVQVVT